MKVPMRWLADFVDTGLAPRELMFRMTMAGLEAEKLEEIGADWGDKVFVGYVDAVVRHPDADRLVLATVSYGQGSITVVTGAPNIREGQKVVLALAGVRLIDGHAEGINYKVLKPGMIRGVKSEGMVCSEKELGISEEHEGILILPDDAPVGTYFKDYAGDAVVEFEITPNLVHAFSILGIAREAAALVGQPYRLPAMVDLATLPAAPANLVTIEAPDLCPRYMGITITGVQVGPSPQWMQTRLRAAGLRPINNIVDVTNYVMLEIGSPLHAFDRAQLAEGRVVIRRAGEGEPIETLDHVQRTLTAQQLVIADAARPVAIAGVMGGVDSEVSEGTTEILLEGANFAMTSIRHTSRALKLRSDASGRFERGIDPNLVTLAMARATRLILDLCPGATVTGMQDAYPGPVAPREIAFAFSRIERLLGISYSEAHVLDVLGRLELQPRLSGDGDARTLTVTTPTYRKDLQLREDIIEEIARISGYGDLPDTLPSGRATEIARDAAWLLGERVREALVGSGCAEAVTYPVVGDADLAPFTGDDGRAGLATPAAVADLLRLKNPLNADRPYMRPTVLPGLLEVAVANLKHQSGVRFFEISRAYLPSDGELPTETPLLGLVLAGARASLSRFEAGDPLDLFDGKGLVDEAARRAGIGAVAYRAAQRPGLHPGRTTEVLAGDTVIGVLGELRPDVAAALGFEVERVVVAELDLTAVLALVPERPAPIVVPRVLPVEQDFAIVVDEAVTAADLEAALRGGAGPLVTGIALFDIYRGAQIGEGKKSVAFRVTFTAPDRALTDDDIARVRPKIEKTVKQRVGGVLRA